MLIPGWVGLCTFWDPVVSPTNSPVRLGVSPTAASTPTGSYLQSEVFTLYFPILHPCVVRSTSLPIFSPSLSALECGTGQSSSSRLTQSVRYSLAKILLYLGAHLCPTYPTGECFFFNSLVVRLPYSTSFCQLWLLLVFKFDVVLISVVQRGTVYLPTPPS